VGVYLIISLFGPVLLCENDIMYCGRTMEWISCLLMIITYSGKYCSINIYKNPQVGVLRLCEFCRVIVRVSPCTAVTDL